MVRVGPVAVRVALDAAPNELVVPTAYPADAAAWIVDDRRAELSALFAATLGEGTPVWVVHGDTAWHGVAGRTDWQEFPPGPVPPAPTTPARRRTGALAGIALGTVGVAAGVGGNLLARDASARSDTAPDQAAWAVQSRRWYGGAALEGAGVALCGVGIGVATGLFR